ncbi:MAG TPA: TonB family protein, partial [Sphingobium sp.]|nr:TonB family protein [Sphingobium sp.]
MEIRVVLSIWSVLSLLFSAVPAVAQGTALKPANDGAGWLESDLPVGTLFVADDDGHFRSCIAPPGQDTSDFRKRCRAYLKANRLMRAMASIGNPSEWIKQSDYPASAIANHAEGVSKIKVTVETNGLASHCEIVKSSGFDDLDQAACT